MNLSYRRADSDPTAALVVLGALTVAFDGLSHGMESGRVVLDGRTLPDERLGAGAFRAHSGGRAECVANSTRWSGYWRISYRDDEGCLVLDTVELSGMPDVLIAGQDDIRDSRCELAHIIERLQGVST